MDSSCSNYLNNIKYITELKLHYKHLSFSNEKNYIKCKYKIYDCFTYFNEIDLLLFRIDYTYKYVEKFIIIEADTTHTGVPKPTKLDLNLIPKKYHNKIIYKYISFTKECNTPWKREYYQRDIIKDILLTFNHDDICIISDCDEIANYETLIRYLNKYNLYDKLIHYINPTYLYNIHNLQYDYHPSCAISCNIKSIKNNTISKLRFNSIKNFGTKIKWIGKDKIWISEAKRKDPFIFNNTLTPDLFTYNKLPCFIHYNRFQNPYDLYIKEHAIAESGARSINYNLDLKNKLHILKNILFPIEVRPDLYQKYIENPNIPNNIYKHFHIINFLDKESALKLWNIINTNNKLYYNLFS